MLFRPLAVACLAVLLAGTAAFGQSVTVGSLTLTDLWTRATPPGAPTAGGYLTITNTGTEADHLLSVSSPVADAGELHQMQMSNGIMEMRPVAGGIEVPAGATVTLGPSGFHMMFVTLKQPLENGGEFPVTLIFDKAGPITTTLHIYPVGSKGPESAANHDATGGMDMGNH